MTRVTRNNVVPVVYRRTASELKGNTVFLVEDVYKDVCRCCGDVLPRVSFYLENKDKATKHDQRRSFCVTCWDLYGGNIKKSYQTPGNTLEEFLTATL